jgi:MFS superfamily sulfate permease-like transporter
LFLATAEYGLYTSLMPPFLYMLMGTCQQMSFGVTAIESILVSVREASNQYIAV